MKYLIPLLLITFTIGFVVGGVGSVKFCPNAHRSYITRLQEYQDRYDSEAYLAFLADLDRIKKEQAEASSNTIWRAEHSTNTVIIRNSKIFMSQVRNFDTNRFHIITGCTFLLNNSEGADIPQGVGIPMDIPEKPQIQN